MRNINVGLKNVTNGIRNKHTRKIWREKYWVLSIFLLN